MEGTPPHPTNACNTSASLVRIFARLLPAILSLSSGLKSKSSVASSNLSQASAFGGLQTLFSPMRTSLPRTLSWPRDGAEALTTACKGAPGLLRPSPPLHASSCRAASTYRCRQVPRDDAEAPVSVVGSTGSSAGLVGESGSSCADAHLIALPRTLSWPRDGAEALPMLEF